MDLINPRFAIRVQGGHSHTAHITFRTLCNQCNEIRVRVPAQPDFEPKTSWKLLNLPALHPRHWYVGG